MDIQFVGHIDGIRFTDKAVLVTASEKRRGYKAKNGTKIDDEIVTFHFIFKSYFRKYISEHFSSGTLVKIKGWMLPYSRDKEGNFVDGYTIVGQTIDIAPYPSNAMRFEKKIIRESTRKSSEMPDMEAFNEEDF